MRKLLVAAIAAVAVLAISGIAYAVNEYDVKGSSKPVGGGTPKKPKPVSLSFDFSVSDEDPANRGTPIEKYFIAAEGLVTYPEAFPQCPGDADGANNEDLSKVKSKCRKARVGGGIIKAYAGAPSDQTQKLNCVLELNLYNLKPGSYNTSSGLVKIGKKHGGLAIRVDGKQVPTDQVPSLDDQYKGKCAVAQNEAILAKYAPVKVKGVTSDELQFVVPPSLLHVGGCPSGVCVSETVVQTVESDIRKRTAQKKVKGKMRKVGFYSAIGCKGGKRSIQVTFITESGDPKAETDDKGC